ncbi:aromatic acid/H+ symport family MFS transporter [Crenobacter sp. SG2303]|uniref:Aromatic acid/H+ symport family MFS transporter n=1 Tax=Crenobacter oryzisoli TaxID=3056844 RepID=A0ABT7XMZ7_9NEIS|nr:aromatic acid/H+ symport family MFS transporter [Crenobacter sp. SG2303]MDN0075164.1 aromatic acid/H+ symport family MFS transporter [Crenobacter sp. SG2303]
MTAPHAIDVRALINDRPVGLFQKLVVLLGFCIIALDGFDVAIMGFIAPQLKHDWGVTNQMLGPVLSAALAGLAVGALFAGPLADRFGRKMILVCSVFFFGVWTLATATSTDVTHLVAFRFLTGLGLGAAMPNVGTLVSEYAPDKNRSFLVTVVFCGFTFGAAGGGFLSAWMIPAFGWHSVLVLGGILPLIVAPILFFKLPESVRFLVVKRAPTERIRKIVDRLAPGVATTASTFEMSAAASATSNESPVKIVLSKQYKFGSLMLWLGYFTALFLVYLLGSWLPTLVKEAGYNVTDAAIVTALYQAGGTIGSLFLGWCMDRANPHRVLSTTYLLGGALTFAIGLSAHHFGLLGVLALAVGFCLNGANTGMNALSASFYPTAARATGSSWMHGVGRWGAMLSAFAGAQMLAMGWTFSQVFAALTVPAAITALAIIAKGMHGARAMRVAANSGLAVEAGRS